MPEVLQYPVISEPNQTFPALQKSVSQLKEAVELLTGQRGSKQYSLVEGLLSLQKDVNGPYGTVSGRIMELTELTVTANEALAQRTLTLETEIVAARAGEPNLLSRITQVDTSRVNGDSALAVRATNLEVEVTNARQGQPNMSARITQVDTARVDGDVILAGSVDTLNTTVGANSASISVLTSSMNGVNLKFGVNGTINGVTGGFSFNGVLRNDGAVIYNMEFFSNVTIHGSLTVAGTIDNPQITNNAVSRSSFNSSNSYFVDVSITVRAGADVLLVGTIDGSAGTTTSWATPANVVRIQRLTGGTSTINTCPVAYFRDIGPTGSAQWFLLSTTIQARASNLAAGTYVFRVISDTAVPTGASMFAIELSK